MLISQLFCPLLLSQVTLFDHLLLITKENVLYILELTIGFEANTQINSESKASKYHPLQQTLLPNYKNLETEIGTALCAIGAEGTLTFFVM